MMIPANRKLGVPLDVHPAEVLLESVREAAGNVAYLRWEVQQLELGLTEGELEVLPDGRVALVGAAGEGEGIAGRVDPDNWKVEPHVLVKMYNEERDRLAKYSKLACDAGVAERLVRLVEAEASEIVRVLQYALDGLTLSAEQSEVVRERLRHALSAADSRERAIQAESRPVTREDDEGPDEET